jgi:biotin synthase
MFDHLLKEAKAHVTPELALRILEESRSPENALQLFQIASELRDRHLGRQLWWSAAIEGILPCKLQPMCQFCSYSNLERLSNESLLKALRALEDLGFRHLHLSGGTNPTGYDAEIVDMVSAMRSASPSMAIEVNLGPSLSRETVRKLKHLGVHSITSSLETMNEELFRIAKPGDSLSARKALLEACEEEGMAVRGMMLLGLGEPLSDRVNMLFYMSRFKMLCHLRFSRYLPPQTNHLKLPRCSPWEMARTIGVARLIMPTIQLGLAAGNSHDDIPLWFIAGGGNQLVGAAASRKKAAPGAVMLDDSLAIMNRMETQQQYVNGMGISIGFECPPGA